MVWTTSAFQYLRCANARFMIHYYIDSVRWKLTCKFGQLFFLLLCTIRLEYSQIRTSCIPSAHVCSGQAAQFQEVFLLWAVAVCSCCYQYLQRSTCLCISLNGNNYNIFWWFLHLNKSERGISENCVNLYRRLGCFISIIPNNVAWQ